MTEYYAEMLEVGLAFQDLVLKCLWRAGLGTVSYSSKNLQKLGENSAGFEIKFDRMFSKTGNFYIEYAEKTNKEQTDFLDSGIKRNDNTWLWIIGNYDELYIFSKLQLLRMLDRRSENIRFVSNPTSLGFVIPVQFCIDSGLCLRRINVKELENKIGL